MFYEAIYYSNTSRTSNWSRGPEKKAAWIVDSWPILDLNFLGVTSFFYREIKKEKKFQIFKIIYLDLKKKYNSL